MKNLYFQTFTNYMNKNPLSASEEDYLEMIYRIEQKDGVRVSALAESLNVAPASVSKMVKRLKNKGYLYHPHYQKIELTKEGKEIAIFLMRRHQLLESFFTFLNDTNNLIEKVEKMEHTLSLETLDKLQLLMQFFEDHHLQEAFQAYFY